MDAFFDMILFNKGAYISFMAGIIAVIYAVLFVVVKSVIKKQ